MLNNQAPKPVNKFIPPTVHYPKWAWKLDRRVYQLVLSLKEYCSFDIVVTSGFRTPEHNMRVGGVPKSAHCKGLAVDIQAKNDRERYEILGFVNEKGICRYGVYIKHIHFDIDPDLPQNVVWFEWKP